MATEPTTREPENIAATLARVLPEAQIVATPGDHTLFHVILPPGRTVQTVDVEKTLPAPRRTKGKFTLSDTPSFIEYIKHHRAANPAATVWCQFNPQTFDLKFLGVLDEHQQGTAGWREHTAAFEPGMSAEWKAWMGQNGKPMNQVDFAEWLENHEEDIAEANGLPTLLQMKTMATNFVARQEMRFKSAIRLMDGSVRMEYINDADENTVTEMKLFDRFCIGIPVFWGGQPWQITARLKYSTSGGKVSFRYELVRPDRVHEAAAKELIQIVRDAIAPTPLRMGA